MSNVIPFPTAKKAAFKPQLGRLVWLNSEEVILIDTCTRKEIEAWIKYINRYRRGDKKLREWLYANDVLKLLREGETVRECVSRIEGEERRTIPIFKRRPRR